MSTRSVSRAGRPALYRVGRDASVIAISRREVLDRSISAQTRPAGRRSVVGVALPLISDRRFWDPAALQVAQGEVYSPRTVSGGYTRLVVQPVASRRASSFNYLSPPLYYPTAQVGFHAPRRVAVCVRRHVRRQVLFARGRLGHGSRPVARPRRNWTSSISCRG